ncbi:hypothetical protein G6F61_003783 [Rhizopus arrhizus]|nr:hypothetical protein G6F61_003783 [Rhizopus arrhizus]
MNYLCSFPRFSICLEIGSSLLNLADDRKEVNWPALVEDMKEFIVNHYDGKSLICERGDWKRRLKSMAKSLGFKIIRFNEDAWQNIHETLITLQIQYKSSTKSSKSNYKLSEAEKDCIVANYDNTEKEDRWFLSTDPDDQVWKDYFTLAELNEIKSVNIKPLKNIPEELESYLDLYDKEWENGLDLYEFADSKKHHPIKEF